MLPPVFPVLKASTPVASIIGPSPIRAFRHGHVPQDTVAPYVVWSSINSIPSNNLSSLPSDDRVTIEVDCYSLDDTEIVQLATAVRNAIEPYAHMTGVPVDMQEPDTRLYRMSLQFDWFLSR